MDVLDSRLATTPLIEGECEADYKAFHASCISAVLPKDAIEEIWLQDFVVYSWEAQRLRRMKVAVINASRKSAVEDLLRELLENNHTHYADVYSAAKSLSHNWSSSDKETVEIVEGLLKDHNLDLDTITAKAVLLKLKDIERIDKLIASSDYRRDAAIRELEKRRDLLAKRAREFTDAVITDVEAELLEAAE